MTPQQIGRYHINRELGRGGMAVVYLARDPFMEREVAVKVLPRQFTHDPQFKARFQREAQVIAALDHPAIVPVYDFGEHDGQPYIVMRYMKGGSLADKLKKTGPLPLGRAARVLERIGSALDEAHRRGVVHRDLKPGNILFDDRDDSFVGDFGIVKLSEATVQYTGNAVIGTPGYMSPEQARGEANIDGRSDVYSLGAIVYEMLTGKLPYDSDTPVGLMMKHIMEPVPNALVAKPDLPPATATVISRAMAKEPNQRYQNCSEVASALTQAATSAVQATVIEPTSGRQAAALDETILEEPAGSVSAAPKPPPFPPAAGQPTEAKARRKIPVWSWAVGCLGLLICGGAALALGGFGVFNSFFGDPTPTPGTTVAVAVISPTVTDTPTASPPPTAAATETPEPVIVESVEVVEVVPSNVPTSEGVITYGETVTGAVDEGGRDVWNLIGFDGDLVDVIVEPLGELDVVVDVLDQSGNSMLANGAVDDSFGTEEIRGLQLLATGDYQIVISGFLDSSGEYELGVSLSNQLGEVPGSTVSAADMLGAEDEHFFPFTAASVSTVTARVESLDELDVVLGIWNDDSEELLEEVDASFTSEELTYVLPAAGNYYFKVTGYDGAVGQYSITLFGPPDVSFELALGDEVFARFDENSQIDYLYSGQPNDTLSVFVEPVNSLDIVVEVYDADELSAPLAEVDSGFGGEEERLTYSLPEEGLYVIRVQGFAGEIGSFQLTVE